MFIVRIILAVILCLFALLFWYATFTVPAFAATSYLIIALLLSAGTYFVSPWRFRSKKVVE